MLIKLSITVAVFYIQMRLIVAENPVERVTCEGKFLGWFAVPPKTNKIANRHWRGDLSLLLGRHHLITTSVQFHRIRDPGGSCQLHNSPIENQISHIQLNGELSSSDISDTTLTYSNITEALESTTAAPTASSSQARSLKESDEILHINDVDDVDRVKRETEEMETTTTTTIETSENKIQDTTLSTTLEVPQKPAQVFMSSDHHKFPYRASSSGINAQHISITHRPPVKNYYDFYPSAPDFYYHNYNSKPKCRFYDSGFRPVYFATNSYW